MIPMGMSGKSARTRRFERIFRTFAGLGFNVVPAHPERKHPSGAWKGLSDPNSRRATQEDIQAGLWVLDAFPEAELEPFLFPASHATRPLAVVDVDDLTWLPTSIEIFGDTPIKVWTRRGVHLYYRTDPAKKVTSRSWIFGEKSVDVKSWGAGVMSPGASYLDKTATYRPEIDLELWTDELLDSLPVFDINLYDRVYAEHRPKARALARSVARPETHPFVVEGEPTKTAAGMEYLGDVRGDVTVIHERTQTRVRLDAVPIGDKVHALGREDEHASGQVWAGRDGRLFYTDHTLGTVWKIIAGRELEWIDAFDRTPDPIGRGQLEADLAEHYPDITIVTLQDKGWISDQIRPAEGLTIIRAPHGTGKTILAKDLIDSQDSAITVANTAALAEHNAERFGIACYRDETAQNKTSTTINSLPKLEVEGVDVFHVDEADAVHGYLHTGNVSRPAETLRSMLDQLAGARFGLVTSADLSFEDISFFVDAVRERDPGKPVRVFVRKPAQGRRTIELVPLTTAKARFESTFADLRPGDFPIALGWTARSDVAAAAWGYANRRPDVDLRSFWVSGENSRFDETIERFRGRWTDQLGQAAGFLDSADVFFFSPALQSGVSLESRVGTVFLLHTKPDFEVETVGQMLMRFRDVSANIVWGSSSFGRRSIRMDDCYLDGVCVALADETDRQIVKALPEFRGEFPKARAVDPEFARSWRITQRKIRKSYADPIGRAREVIESHGWTLIESVEISDEDRKLAQTFNRTRSVGSEYRDEETAQAIAEADKIDHDQAERIDRAHVHRADDRQRLERHRIGEFYGVADVDLELVRLDAKGKFRRSCRTFALLWLLSEGRRDVVAFLDYLRSRGKQASEYRHAIQRTDLLAKLHDQVLVRPFGPMDWTGEPDEFDADDLRDRTMEFVRKNGRVWSELFGRPSQPGVVTDPTKAIAWLGAQFKRSGGSAFVTGASKARRYAYDWSEVFRWSEAERTRLLESFETDKTRETWASRVKEIATR